MRAQNPPSEFSNSKTKVMLNVSFVRQQRGCSLWDVIFTMVMTLISLQISCIEALTPIREFSHILTPISASSFVATSETNAAIRQGLSAARNILVQECLDIQRPDEEVKTEETKQPDQQTQCASQQAECASSQTLSRSASPQPQSRSTSPQLQSRSTSPQPQSQSTSPQLQSRSASPQLQSQSTSPQPQSQSTSPQPQSRSASPQLQSRSTSPQPQSRSASPQLQSRSTSPQLQSRSTSPQPQSRSTSPQLQSRSASPQPQSRSASPQLQSRSTSPQLQSRSTSPQPQSRSTHSEVTPTPTRVGSEVSQETLENTEPHAEPTRLESGPRRPATSTWVRHLQFKYGNLDITVDQFVNAQKDLVIQVEKAKPALRTRSRFPNVAIAQLSAVYREADTPAETTTGASASAETTTTSVARHGVISRVRDRPVSNVYQTAKRLSMPEYVPSAHQGTGVYAQKVLLTECYISGQSMSAIPCKGWNDVFPGRGGVYRFQDFLRRNDILGKLSDRDHAHSEQALAAHLYAHACRPTDPPMGSVTPVVSSDCILYREAAKLGEQMCDIKLFVLDIISVSNSVCDNCDISLNKALFVERFTNVLDVRCRELGRSGFTRPKIVVRTMSGGRYSRYKHISCAGINAREILPLLLEDDDPITFHRLPSWPASREVVLNDCNNRNHCSLQQTIGDESSSPIADAVE